MSAVFTISISTLGNELIGTPARLDVVTVALLMLVVPKSASELSVQEELQSSGRSTIHSADDCAAEKGIAALVNVQLEWWTDTFAENEGPATALFADRGTD